MNIVITGVSRGIGKGIAQFFFNKGYQVFGIDINEAKHEFISRFYKIDLSQIQENSDILKQILAHTDSKIDVLVNNAAVQILGDPVNFLMDDWQKTLDVNVSAPLFLIRTFYRALKKAQGCVVNISSIHSKLTKPEFFMYAASKGALTSLTKSLAVAVRDDFRINAVLPGAVMTEMLKEGLSEKGLKNLIQYIPAKHIYSTEEIARAVFYLADKESNITGCLLNMDGATGFRLHDPE